MSFKRIMAILMILICTVTFISAQNTDRELTVEEFYMLQSIELMIIREQSRADSREMKAIALEYINEAIQRGNTGEEIVASLEYLGIEGIINQTRENGRLLNNYPDIRMKAAAYLGDIGTPEARASLFKMAMAEKEPMVLTEIIRSLGKIGNNENHTTSELIESIVFHYNSTNPDNLLALAALEAYEKLALSNNGIIHLSMIESVMSIINGYYLRPVQQRAMQTLATLRSYTLQARPPSANN